MDDLELERKPIKPMPGDYDWKPSREQRIIVREMAAMGATVDDITQRIEDRLGIFISAADIKRMCARELKAGVSDANLAVARSLFTLAVRGDTKAAMFWLKARAGWRENDPVADQPMATRTQISVNIGPDGGGRQVNLLIQAQSYMASSIPQDRWPQEVREFVGIKGAQEAPQTPAQEAQEAHPSGLPAELMAPTSELELKRVRPPTIEVEPPGKPIDLDRVLAAGLGGPLYQEGEDFLSGRTRRRRSTTESGEG